MKFNNKSFLFFGCVMLNSKDSSFDHRHYCGDKFKSFIFDKGFLIYDPLIHDGKIVVAHSKFSILWGRIYKSYHSENTIISKREIANNIQIDPGATEGSFVYVDVEIVHDRCSLFICTDKYGSRPLFYTLNQGRLFFSNHLSGIKVLLGFLPGCSTDALLHYYNFGVTQNNQTLFDGIYKLPPGHSLTVNKNGVSIKEYFTVADLYSPDQFTGKSEEAICKELDDKMSKAVSSRIQKGEKVGITISGGVDSGYIAQKMVQESNKVIGYNLAYEGFYNEFDRVDYLAKELGFILRKVVVTPSEIIKSHEEVNSFSSEPVAFNNATLRYLYVKALDDKIDIIFDGDGADRLFLGMNRHLQYQKLIKLFNGLKSIKALPLVTRLLCLSSNQELKKIALLFENWNRGIIPYPERNLGIVGNYSAQYEDRIYSLGAARFVKQFKDDIFNDDFGLYFTYHSIQMCPEIFFHSPIEIQSALGLSPISPFWDDAIVSMAMSLPTHLKLKKGKTKYILRKAASLNFNNEYWMLPKIGLQSSYAYVLQSDEGKDWRNRMDEEITSSPEYKHLKELVPDGIVDTTKLLNLIVWKKKNCESIA